jgi:hypothetical protein
MSCTASCALEIAVKGMQADKGGNDKAAAPLDCHLRQ